LFADPRTVEVSGVMKDVSNNFLLMYFENEGKSGGGIVEDIQKYDDNTAYVTFESSEGNYCLLLVPFLFLLIYKEIKQFLLALRNDFVLFCCCNCSCSPSCRET